MILKLCRLLVVAASPFVALLPVSTDDGERWLFLVVREHWGKPLERFSRFDKARAPDAFDVAGECTFLAAFLNRTGRSLAFKEGFIVESTIPLLVDVKKVEMTRRVSVNALPHGGWEPELLHGYVAKPAPRRCGGMALTRLTPLECEAPEADCPPIFIVPRSAVRAAGGWP
ncbi:MAG: hypothetical protein AAFW01_00200 [Pseudomonadota bacterium]